jgi:hypothetical protein
MPSSQLGGSEVGQIGAFIINRRFSVLQIEENRGIELTPNGRVSMSPTAMRSGDARPSLVAAHLSLV